MSCARDRMDFPISAERRAFRPPGCSRPNNDVAALLNAGLCPAAALDIIMAAGWRSSIAQFVWRGASSRKRGRRGRMVIAR